MSAPGAIDTLEFAHSAQELSASVPVTALQRLEDILYDSAGRLEYTIRGRQDERRRPLLELTIGGSLNLRCQRCLGKLEYRVQFENTLLVVPPGAPVDEELDDPEAPDTIEANPELDAAALIEDEVLLSLPLAPRHPEGTCASRFDTQSDDAGPHSASDKEADGARAPSAFDKLAALKRPRNKH
jgi:uncharacterized protein